MLSNTGEAVGSPTTRGEVLFSYLLLAAHVVHKLTVVHRQTTRYSNYNGRLRASHTTCIHMHTQRAALIVECTHTDTIPNALCT